MNETILTKTCIHCNQIKPIESYYLKKKLGTARIPYCKECHYKKYKKIRDTKCEIIKISDIRRFLLRVDKTDKCWNWKGYLLPKGYGTFTFNGYSILAHRFSYLLYRRTLPKDLFVLHSCDNPRCVNPKHLFLGTNQDNVDDMVAKNRQSKGEGKGKLTNEQILTIRDLAQNGFFHSQIAKQFNISRSNISMIVRRDIWKHI